MVRIFASTLLGALSLARLGRSQIEAAMSREEVGTTASTAKDAPLSVGYVLFPGFEPLDVFGPLEILYSLSGSFPIALSTVSFSAGPVSARAPAPFSVAPDPTLIDPKNALNPQVMATHSFANAPHLDVIIVPGGVGDFLLDNQNNFTMEKFIASRAADAKYVMSVCTGATTLARAGVLKGRRATTNKSAWAWATSERHAKGVEWVPNARWVVDGNVWTSSGVAAGLDMMWAFATHYFGAEAANGTVNGIEYTPHTDPTWDAFAVVHNVPGANRNRSVVDCVAPAGW